MALHSMHKTFHHSHLGEEKHQMLNLNQRLETYLSRVKLLEEENMLLAKEIQALRHSNHGAPTRREGLEEELRQARLELDAAWRNRIHTELEIGRLTEEFQALDLQRQREAQAHMKAKTMLEKSRRELEEEQRAQIWLRKQVSQLEQEMRLLIQTHQEDVAHLEATMTHSRATMPPTLAQKGNQTLLQLGQEYSQRATRAWQEAAQAYQGQLARLEESLNQARSRLAQVGQEKGESQLKLQALEKEIASAQDVRLNLERTAAQQRDRHSQEIQQLQGHVGGLEAEKEELGQQINCLLLENRSLLQLKMSLGLEVATYRALLDSESLRGDIALVNQPRNISITDAVFKKNYQTQLSASHKNTSLLPLHVMTGTAPAAMTATPLRSRKPATFSETPKILKKPADTAWETPYPKILQDGAVENFRPQEVHEKVTYAEPLSPPNEQEAFAQITSEGKDGEDNRKSVDDETPDEIQSVESVVSYQVESGLSSTPPFKDDVSHHQVATPNLSPHHVRMTESSDKDVPFEGPAEKEDMQHAPIDAGEKKECMGKTVEHVQEESSDSETEALLEPTFESMTSSPASECEPGESVFNQLHDDANEIREETSSSMVGTNETDVEDKLYPDGEEMDTWDTVIERKVDLKTEDGTKNDEVKTQHAEPEEDISAREPVHEKTEVSQDFATSEQQDNNMDSSVMDTQVDDDGKDATLYQENDKEDDDEEEDSQNVCVSWRTELESDSYAQDNTLADTRPLIRYKSDETDANTQASHMEESESSEGEQEKNIVEMGSVTWSEGKSKRFGTMEDLCEEVEGEALGEEYDLGYTHIEDRDVSHTMTVSEHATSVNDTENAEEMIKKVGEGCSDEETEEFTKPMVPTNIDYDAELETDRLVEQELENLSTDSYSAHFAQQQVSESEEMLPLQGKSIEKMTEQEEAGETKTERDDMSFCAESGVRVNSKLASSTTIIDQPFENLHFGDSSVAIPQTDTVADEEVQRKDQEATGAAEKRDEEAEHNVSMVTHADATDDCSGFSDFISRPDTEEINNSEDPNSSLQEYLQDVAAPTEVKEVVPVEECQQHLLADVVDCQSFSDVPETAKWEALENMSEDFEVRDQNEHDQKCDDMPDSAERYLHDDTGSDEERDAMHKEEPLDISTDSVPEENDILVVKDSTELLNTNGKDNSHHGVFSSGIRNDFWVSSLETGATYQPDAACNEAAEQINQNLGFGDSLVWGSSDNPYVVNGNSRGDIDSSKALTATKEQEEMHSGVKPVLSRNAVEGELVHSEESEVEGDSWSSGEELV